LYIRSTYGISSTACWSLCLKARKLSLTKSVQKGLKHLTKSRSLPAKIVMRERLILLAHNGSSVRQIAGLVDCVPSTVSNWMVRWLNESPQKKRHLRAWFEDRPRSGAPCKFSINQRSQIIALACEKPEDHGLPITTWTSEEIGQTAIKENLGEAISRRHVSRILLDVDLKPHRSRYWLNSKPDPQKAHKIKVINKAYKEAKKLEKKGILIFSLDEMTGIQALERIAEDKPSKPGLIRCIEYEYERHGTLCLLGAYNVAQGTLIGLVLPQRTEEDFVALIDHIVQEHPEAKGFRFILDNLNTHQSETLVKYIAGKENIDLSSLGVKGKSGILKNMTTRQEFLKNSKHKMTFLYTPKHASWMNQIEIVFGIIARKAIRRGNFFSKEHLKERLHQFIDYFNENLAKPFEWNYGNKPLKAN